MRIVSLVPSLTEYLWALGLEQEVVGITKFCIHPKAWWQHKTRVGGTKKVNFKTIETLQPTLIIANKEENTKEDIEQLQLKYDVLLTDITSLEEAYRFLLEIGRKVQREEKSMSLVNQIQAKFQSVVKIGQGSSFLYFIWKDPYFVVGPQTYIHALLTHFGLVNFCEIERYPALEQVLNNKDNQSILPDYIFLSSEPFPFEAKHLEEVQVLFPNSKIVLIDGEICSWYGSRMLKAPSYFKDVLQGAF
ncbi:MAG: ABC transporter substrate-binding protein [Flavobacteriales bacterium]|jgi:ABC-type Fe3+-hydroxamate transport system substrate-binding protein